MQHINNHNTFQYIKMTFFSMLYNLSTDVLTFWMPVFFSFKFLMEKDMAKIPTILKFWCMISVYSLISLIISQLLDEDIFPFFNIACLIVLNLPPYDITQKMYNNTLGVIYNQNRKSFESLEQAIIKMFDKNSETLKNKMKDSTGQKIKGMVGDILMATMTASTKSKQPKDKKKRQSSDDDQSQRD